MLLLVLRFLTLAGYAGVAGGLLRLHRSLPTSRTATTRAWRWLALPYGVILFNLLIYEARAAILPLPAGHPWADTLGTPFYHALYLAQSAVGASIPVALLALMPREARWRRAAVAAFAILGVLVAVAVVMGSLARWSTLLASTRAIYYLAIGAHVLFWALLALGALRPVGRHLAVFVALETLFTVLLPVQEAFFAVLGREASERIWHVNQFLQAATALSQTGVVFSRIRAGKRDVRARAADGVASSIARTED